MVRDRGFFEKKNLTVFILGGSGLLGSHCLKRFSEEGWDVWTTYRSVRPPLGKAFHLDLLNVSESDLVSLLEEARPDWIINCIAQTDVDFCQRFPEEARAINVEGVGRISSLCLPWSCGLIHLSSDSVYGNGSPPHQEESDCYPLSIYGQTKLDSENLATGWKNGRLLLIRTAFYGINQLADRGFLNWALEALNGTEQVFGYKDVWFSPISAASLVETMILFMKSPRTGVVNVGSRDGCTKYEFLLALKDILNAKGPLVAVESKNMARDAIRASSAELSTQRLERWLGKAPPCWREDLQNYIATQSKANLQRPMVSI